MKIDFDTSKEILDTLTRNKSRSFLTGFGVFWGIFMLVVLMGGGQGMKESLAGTFEGFATNSAMVWAQPTTKPFAGFRKGRTWSMVYDDMERLKQQVPELDVVTPMLFHGNNSQAVLGKKKASVNVKGTDADFVRVQEPQLLFGRYINEIDVAHRRKVCVIGKRVYNTLFASEQDPTGQLIRVDSVYYTVVGVDISEGNMNFNGSSDDAVVVPYSLMQQTYNLGNSVAMFCLTGKPGVKMGDLSQRIRTVIGRAHHVNPTDEKAIMVFNTEALFGMMDNLFRGVNFLVWLVGIGTLLAGAIGVSNIMLVTVRERTSEIGIRRAIGATPSNIIGQILCESLILTLVAGMSGLIFSVFILQMLQMGTTTDGIVKTHYQVGFWPAIGALVLLIILGMLAGMAPALRALSVKPVDAMREE